MKLIKYILFEKYKTFNKKKINKNRRNFAITIFELLKTSVFSYKDEITQLLNESVNHNINGNYEIYIYKLKSLHNSSAENNKYYYQDLIVRSKNSYNKYYIH